MAQIKVIRAKQLLSSRTNPLRGSKNPPNSEDDLPRSVTIVTGGVEMKRIGDWWENLDPTNLHAGHI